MANFNKKITGKQLIGNRQVNSDEALGLVYSDVKNAKLINVNTDVLIQNPYQPRLTMDVETIKELAESIKQSGLLQPIIITPFNGSPNKFYIVAGHRRVAAVKYLGNTVIDAIVVNIDHTKLKLNAILENLQREDLSPFEEALAIKALVDSGIKQAEIAEKLGKKASFISQMIRISTLSPTIQEFILLHNMTPNTSLLYELTNIKDETKQLNVLQHIDKKSMTREDIRIYIKQINEKNEFIEKSSKPVNIGFLVKQSKDGKKINIILDINKLKDRSEAISTLEKLLESLKNV